MPSGTAAFGACPSPDRRRDRPRTWSGSRPEQKWKVSPLVIEAVLAGRGIDRHAADGVAHGCRFLSVMVVAGVADAGVTIAAAQCAVAGALRRSGLFIGVSGLEQYTHRGYIGRMRRDIKTSCQNASPGSRARSAACQRWSTRIATASISSRRSRRCGRHCGASRRKCCGITSRIASSMRSPAATRPTSARRSRELMAVIGRADR